MISRARMLVSASAALAFFTHATSGETEDRRFEVGPRFALVTAGGEPSNDLMGVGLYATYRVGAAWGVGFAVDSLGGDFELPNQFVGVSTPEVFDSTFDSLIVRGWVDREYGRAGRPLRWFWTAGLGFASPDVEDVSGPTSGGGTFDITTDAGTETILGLSGGLRRRLGSRFGFEVALRADHHVADWKVTDRVSGQTGSVDDYTALGIHVGVTVRF